MPGPIADPAHRAPERRAPRRLDPHRGDRERVPPPHDAQHRGTSHRHRQGRGAPFLCGRGAGRARPHAQRRHGACRGPLSHVGALRGSVRAAGGAWARGARGPIGYDRRIRPRARVGALRMSWFDKIMPSRIKTERRSRSVPEGLWIKCPACDAVLYRAELERNLYVCPKCSHHMRIGPRERRERFKRAVDYCIQERRPLVCFSASGGARMQEALYSLLQMAKTAAALSRLAQAHLPFISVLTDPTTGGVSASLALLGDLNLAEP